MDYFRDENGRYQILSSIVENDLIFTYIKYENSKLIQTLGGMYCIWCEDTNNKIYRKNDYLAMKSLSKFIDEQVKIYYNNNDN